MNAHRFDFITRLAAHGISRRGSLMALGGTAVGALAAPITTAPGAEARHKGKNRRCRKKARKKCKRQVQQCHASLEDRFTDPRIVDAYRPCCDHFARCNAREGVACLFIPL